MALDHAASTLRQPQASYATHCSLRGGSLHPLKQNPPSLAPSIAEEREEEFEDVDINDPVRPPPSALTTSATAYDPHASHFPSESYRGGTAATYQRSLTDSFFTNCQPLLNRATSTIQQHTSRSSFHSPTKSLASFIPSRSVIESTASKPKIRAGAQAISNWFNGSSAPVSLGVNPQSYSDDDYDSEEDDEQDDNMMAGIFSRTQALTGASAESTPKPTTSAPAKASTPTAGSKFAWLLSTQKNAANPPRAPSPAYHNPDDELLNLNISQSLFPHGPVDPLAPSSFHDLLSTAETLLTKYQNSYRHLSTAVNDMRAEQSAQDDELEEAETRARHLKMQLETMATRANEQDEQMRSLMEELMFERNARQEEEAARKRSLALVRSPQSPHMRTELQNTRRRTRVSNSDVSVDSGFESETECSDAASIFSRTNGAMSPTDTVPSSAASDIESVFNDSTPKGKRPEPVQRRSTYDKVRDGTVNLEKGGWGCANCEGGKQAAVWGRLAKEREQNSLLRRRVDALEVAIEGALNVVDGPWGM